MGSRVDIAALVGSAVPAHLRREGVLMCWRVLVDGEAAQGTFTNRADAEACQRGWQVRLGQGLTLG
ncbi:hypothetical protein [Pseudomonas sp. NPDC007930]|uniref:hypothetical protein n=1 Tax=Pseudomonas sp. NPDC007930 TaxID=3364417 RepID=UPI0036E92436